MASDPPDLGKPSRSKVSPKEHESCWRKENEFRAELNTLRLNLEKYANAVAAIAGV